MPKNHIFTPQTIDADDDDTDICPVCDGQCTCQKQLRQQPSLPSLKLKLTVPQSLLAKHRLVSSNNAVQTTSGSANHGYLPRKRGRPPKSKPIPSRSRAHSTLSPLDYKSRPSSTVGALKIRHNIKARAALVNRVSSTGRRKKTPHSRKKFDDDDHDEVSSLSSLTDVDMDLSYSTPRFPTFVSASAVESLGSSSDSDSDSDNDSSTLPRDRERERTRTRRELLGDDPLRRKLAHPINNEWVIRSRKTSVDLSEAEGAPEMDVDSESDEEDDETSDGLQDEDAEDEADQVDAETPVLTFLESQDSETTDNLSSAHPHHKQQQRRRHFVRLGKSGWSFSSSDDEESAFDADLFFRYLYDSSSASSSSSGEEEELTEGHDNDDAPLTAPFLCPPKVESLPFELAESWDGGVVFTNGDSVGGDSTVGFVDVERSGRGRFGFRGREDSDTEIDTTMGMGIAGCASCLEDGYLEEDGECDGDEDGFSFNGNDGEGGIEQNYSEDEEGGGGSGDTTDEDLVGSDSLPNERAMGLFKPVWDSVSAIDPLSLVSSRPRRELEMMEVVEGVGEKRRRGKGKNKGKGRMRREMRERGEKGGREKRKEKKRREILPNPLDILEGRGTFWSLEMGMDVDEEETSCLSSSSRDRKVLRSQRTPTPTPAHSPTTPVPATPALSTTTSFTIGPRRGVFVVPSIVSEWTEAGKRKGKAREKAMVIIGEDRKGEVVPSPHPRKRSGQSMGGAGDGVMVEQLLRRHILESASIANIGSDAITTVKTSPPPTPHLGVPFSPIIDDVFSSSPTMKPIQLADVLDAEFLKDDDREVKGDGESGSEGDDGYGDEQELKGALDSSLGVFEGDEKVDAVMSIESATSTTASIGSFQSQGVQTPPIILSDADLAADAAAVKNLNRWDVISVGAFRQTQQQVHQEGGGDGAHHRHVGVGVDHGHEPLMHGHIRTPGSSTDYGNAMKKSGKFALGLLWRGGGGTGAGGKSAKAGLSNSPGTGTMRRTASGGMIGSKQAKKRRLMMNSSSTSVMKEPLVLPATSVAAAGGSNVASSSTAATSHINTNVNGGNVQGKTRKEARRERKLQKRNASQPYSPLPHHSLHPHSHHHHHPHMYHTHYHHPNAKTRGVGSTQRLGGWLVGSGSGSGSGSGGAGTWSGSSGVSGGLGGLSF